MCRTTHPIRALLCLVIMATAATALADPCGMVPPVYVGEGAPITRIGPQKTYVFHANGIESFVIRPGFSGKVEEFGMLIPFPAPPAIHKVSDNIFDQIAAAIDPPEYVIDLRPPPPAAPGGGLGGGGGGAFFGGGLPAPDRLTVRVLREEAVGMYEVAVLKAGSSAALKKWMDEHGYRYPEGMDKVCDEYVDALWCFVAVKTKVGAKSSIDPQPGQRDVAAGLPKGTGFEGAVQAMGFRFPTQKLTVPMRLSAFNEGELRNVVYLLTDGPQKIRAIPEEHVVRQVSGAQLYKNLTGLIPLRIVGGRVSDIPAGQWKGINFQRNPKPHNGIAADLFAADAQAARTGKLAHAHEQTEKDLLAIGERLGLRGAEVDSQINQAVAAQREKVTAASLEGVKRLTLTVVDGDFPREVLARENLSFQGFRMARRRNNARAYDARALGPGQNREGVLILGALSEEMLRPDGPQSQERSADGVRLAGLWSVWLPLAGAVLLLNAVFWRRSPTAGRVTMLATLLVCLAVGLLLR